MAIDLDEMMKRNKAALKVAEEAFDRLSKMGPFEDPDDEDTVTAELAGAAEEIAFRKMRQAHLEAGSVTIQPISQKLQDELEDLGNTIDEAILDDKKWEGGLNVVLSLLNASRRVAQIVDRGAPSNI